ncbi:NFACT family protein [Bacillus aquiflavi]|uniref:Rqc2 homolog RqcH n=1 Tax=Bacillus aquiflavi TaxID=2672567 RepID=A0A6B3W358_9BACI|nr:NFACT RNA binding domain-containing protein [Bacillus aquiflavi]MBA4538085.1 NFACT family protein [Bacillus aquiflavi]NEY82383.1 fibronectin/fibrinogen-binding protein [Bacillus aquiflavi]
MSFDGLFTKATVEELSNLLVGGRITKIQQPYKNEIVLNVRAKRINHKVLLSVHPNYARVQLTKESFENPQEPPMFCMLLRKHLEGFFLENITQVDLDRIIVFQIKGRNEIGDLSYKQLIVEIMGRHSNIILVDRNKNLILDSIKHVSFAVNSYRAVLPGHEYVRPPKQNKQNPFAANETALLQKIDFNSGKLDKQLVAQFAGISPLFAKEVVFRAGIANRVSLPKTFLTLMNQLKEKKYLPAISSNKNKEAFYLFPLAHLSGERKEFLSLGDMLDRFYFGKAKRDRVKQQATDLERFITNEKAKNIKKIKKLQRTLQEAQNSKQYKLFGELLTANLYAITKGMKEIEVINYYHENGEKVTIPLDPQKTPSENAQKYFSKYQKAKNAVMIVKDQMKLADREVQYFDTLLQQIETAAPKDIEEIREELIEEGYLRNRQKKLNKKRGNKQPILEKYCATDGTEIIVGKNNKQNDYLTNKLANKDETWLHTKDIPGSHVVIRSKNPSEATIIEGAILAAYFSKARNSSSVPVDFTKVRHVKKPSGAKPGFVIYENQQTVYVTPSEELVIQLDQNSRS